jgi:hypothetical protein
MRWVYHYLVNKGIIVAIEKLEQKQKEDIWEFVKEVCEGKTTDKVKMLEIAKVFYLMEYFLNESNNAHNNSKTDLPGIQS